MQDREKILSICNWIKIKIIDSDSLSGSSIIQELKGNAGTIWGKLSELNSEGLIEKTKEGYKIVPYKIEQILNTILEDYDTRNIKQIKPKKVKQKKQTRRKKKNHKRMIWLKIGFLRKGRKSEKKQ